MDDPKVCVASEGIFYGVPLEWVIWLKYITKLRCSREAQYCINEDLEEGVEKR